MGNRVRVLIGTNISDLEPVATILADAAVTPPSPK